MVGLSFFSHTTFEKTFTIIEVFFFTIWEAWYFEIFNRQLLAENVGMWETVPCSGDGNQISNTTPAQHIGYLAILLGANFET